MAASICRIRDIALVPRIDQHRITEGAARNERIDVRLDPIVNVRQLVGI